MKRIKTVNGYAIYQAMTQRDADNYNCEVGSFNLYLASDIRDYGLSNSYPEYENIDALASALELANGSNYAIAESLADELSDSTIQDMDLIMEIERRLDNGETVEQITEAYDTEEQCFIENDVGTEEKEERTMKVTPEFEYALTDALYRLCNKEWYFTCGSNCQYDLMFRMAKMPEYTYRDIAMMIFICSEIPDGEDVNSFFSDIQNQVETIYNDIMEEQALARMEEQQAAGERAADEIYCSYYE